MIERIKNMSTDEKNAAMQAHSIEEGKAGDHQIIDGPTYKDLTKTLTTEEIDSVIIFSKLQDYAKYY